VSNNPEILTIWQLRTVVPRPQVLLFTRKSVMNETWQFPRACSKRPPRVSVHQLLGVFPDPLIPTPSTSSATKNPGNTEEDPDDPAPADKGDIKME
jgi:hypothetical protein